MRNLGGSKEFGLNRGGFVGLSRMSLRSFYFKKIYTLGTSMQSMWSWGVFWEKKYFRDFNLI